MNNLNYILPNISCGHCKMNVERELSKVPGITSVVVTVDNKRADISYVAPATVELINELLTEIGYPADIG